VKILQLAVETPVPPTSGARLRMLHLARQLAGEADVEVVALGEADGAGEPFSLRGVPHETGRWSALAGSLRRPYMAAKLDSTALREVAATAQPDTVQAEFPYLVPAALAAGAPVVLSTQNVESEVLVSLAEADPRPLHRRRWAWEARKTARFEADAARSVAAVAATSDHDAEVFEGWGAARVVVVPNGVDTNAIAHRAPPAGAELVYLGQYGYRPNVLAARELAEQILPRVPGATVRLVGRDPGPEVERLAAPAVTVTGEVADPIAELRHARALVVPLRSGGGTRLKVLEALAAGTPVVSTAFGVAGLDVRDGEHVLIGETPEELAALAARVVADDALATGLSARGRELVERSYDWSIVARPLVELHQELAR
jgi:glycosyl transferase family 1/glycosyl transferase family 4